ncbi:MAG TPA: deoxyribose-phosphate aldolase [Verrucomicrobiae bacterium]|nr:deoxyribose-phosphate aldolase [Verrucomicrobiae bacterium]
MDSAAASPATRPPLTTYDELAGMIDLPLVRPDLSVERVAGGLELAKRYRVACASVRPSDLELAVRMLDGTGVKPGSTVGFPHGTQTTSTKLYEARDLLRRGARELDVVIAIPNLLSREFEYVQTEISQVSDICHREGAVIKVILENAYLTDELKIIACRCCERAQADFVKTSTGFAPTGCTLADVKLMRYYLPETIGVKAAGGLRTLYQAMEVYQAGAARIGTGSAAAILDEWKARLDPPKTTA